MTLRCTALVLLQLHFGGADEQQRLLDLQLFQAAGRGDFGQIDVALEAGADIDALIPVGPPEDPEMSKVTALMQAALGGQVGTIEYLLEQGADIDQPDSFGFTPLHGCAFRGEAAACKVLLDSVGPHSKTALHYHADGYAPLHRCCFGDANIDTLRVFLDAGVDPALASIEDRAGRGGRSGTTCYDLATSDAVHKLLAEFGEGETKGGGHKRGSKRRKSSRRKKKDPSEQELSVDDILAAHPDL